MRGFLFIGNPFRELIETLWNVNMGNVARERNIIIELIETLWNVNITVVVDE